MVLGKATMCIMSLSQILMATIANVQMMYLFHANRSFYGFELPGDP